MSTNLKAYTHFPTKPLLLHSLSPSPSYLLPLTVVSSLPLDDGIGHSFCYLSFSTSTSTTTSTNSLFLFMASVPANTSTPLSTSLSDDPYPFILPSSTAPTPSPPSSSNLPHLWPHLTHLWLPLWPPRARCPLKHKSDAPSSNILPLSLLLYLLHPDPPPSSPPLPSSPLSSSSDEHFPQHRHRYRTSTSAIRSIFLILASSPLLSSLSPLSTSSSAPFPASTNQMLQRRILHRRHSTVAITCKEALSSTPLILHFFGSLIEINDVGMLKLVEVGGRGGGDLEIEWR